jgi:hypothetical protein
MSLLGPQEMQEMGQSVFQASASRSAVVFIKLAILSNGLSLLAPTLCYLVEVTDVERRHPAIGAVWFKGVGLHGRLV